ncbi:AAA family ATPase [Lacinutrix salivirga]
MQIEIVNYNGNKVNTNNEVDFIIEQDNWNDYSYYTHYYLHQKNKKGSWSLIGGLKIIKKGQQKLEMYLLELGIIKNLPEDFCSLGNDLDYYSRISDLEDNLKTNLLESINDIIYNPSIIPKYQNEDSFNSSFLRGKSLDDDFFSLAPIILSKQFEEVPDSKDFKFSFKLNSMETPMQFDFSTPKIENSFYDNLLPSRISVLVGRNGSGKSTLLSKIARVAFSSSEERNFLKGIGKIEPQGLGFPRIISISYSAFDSFQVPGTKISEVRQISDDIDNNKGRYIYCGIRDLSRELDLELINIKTDKKGRIDSSSIKNDKYENNLLKSITNINSEIIQAIDSIKSNSYKQEILLKSMEILMQETSLDFLNDLVENNFENKILNDKINNISTGHKFVIHSIVKMIYHIERRSLVLFDEPESHLHPPLLAILMKTIRYILENQKAYMIIATHSPVVVQETLKRNVLIMRREGNISTANSPNFQTFGGSIGNITSNVFYLTSDYTDFHNDLNNIVDSYLGSEESFDGYLDNLFEGDVSMQAYAYMASRYKNQKN